MTATAQKTDIREKRIQLVDKMAWLLSRKKRLKIAVGGRASTKTTSAADYVLSCIFYGQLWCCAREHQNSIEESVHRTMDSEIQRLEMEGFSVNRTDITHVSGGRNFYKGLSRNITSLKGILSGIDGIWIEEGETLSDETLHILTASVRLDAKSTQMVLNGIEVKMPEILVTMNRGSITDPMSTRYLKRADAALDKYGKYEDDICAIVQVNYTDMPKSWFIGSGLEQERLDDLDVLSTAQYRHKWHGTYLDEVHNSIIKPEWVEACIDVHKSDKFKEMMKPRGVIVASHDPSDTGSDDKAYACRHGNVFTRIASRDFGEVDDGCDWAIETALIDNADWFVWDGDGMGAGLKRQVFDLLKGKTTRYHMYQGSLSGSAQDNAGKVYQRLNDQGEEVDRPKCYSDTFLNNRAQYSILLRDRIYNTYRAVVKGAYINPDEMISIDSDGVDDLAALRAEICRIPRKETNTGIIQIMSKKEMKQNGIKSPNQFDAMCMALWMPKLVKEKVKVNPVPTINRW